MGRINKMFNIKLLNMKKLFFGVVALVLMFCGCSSTNSKDKYQSSRDNVINVKDMIHEISTEEYSLSSMTLPIVANDYLVVGDYKATEMVMSIYDTEHFKYIKSFGPYGPGPNEYSHFGTMSWNKFTKELLVFDTGKLLLYSYNIDSVLNDCDYNPTVKLELDTLQFPYDYNFVNDSIAYGAFVAIDGVNEFHKATGYINVNTGKSDIFDYKHPDISRTLFSTAVHTSENLFAEVHNRHDLISIFNLQGNLITNVYGPKWDSDNLDCFWGCFFTKDYLIAEYDGNDYEDHIFPTKCFVFNLSGDYVATLETGYRIYRSCYDEKHNRIIFCFDDTIQLGYLDLDEIKFD